MAFSPIALTIPNYRDFKNYWIKAYVPSTTTPKVMASDKTGSPTVAKFELNTEGFPKTSGGALITPYIDGLYDLWLFPTEAEADANDTSSALRLAINVAADAAATETAAAIASTFDRTNPATLAIWRADTSSLAGDVVTTKERSTGNGGGTVGDVIAGTGTANGGNIVAHASLSLSWVMRLDLEDSKKASAWGILADFNGTTGTDNAARIELAMTNLDELFLDKASRYGHTGIVTPGAISLRGTGIESTSLEMFPTPTKIVILHSHEGQTLKIRDMTIDGGSVSGPFGAGTGVFTEGVYCNLGNLDIDDCIIRRVNSYAIRSGNIELNFDQNKKAGDVYIGGNVLVDQLTAAEFLGDCMRIERTKRFVIEDGAKLNGGLSSLRIQYYVESIVVGDIVTKNNWGDVGVTVALCTDFTINGSSNSGHARHGIELDGVKRGNVNGSINHGNLIDGIIVAEFSPPVGANFEGSIDGVLITSSDVVYPEDIYVGGGTQCFNNGQFGIRISKPNGVTVGDVKLKNNCSENVAFVDAAIFVSGGAVVDSKDVQDVTFTDAVSIVNNENQIRVMSVSDYKVSAERSIKFHSRSIVGGSGERFQFPVTGTFNLNPDPFLVDNADISGTGIASYDALSITGAAYLMDDTSAVGDLNTILKLPNKLRFNSTLLVISHRTDVGTSTLKIAVNLYNGGVYVETVLDTAATSNTGYLDFKALISPSSQSVAFDEVRVDLKTTVAEVTKIYINRIDLFTQF